MAYVDEKTKQLFLSFKPEELGIKKQTLTVKKGNVHFVTNME